MELKVINDKSAGNFGYAACFKDKKVGVYANSSYDAQQITAKHFKARKAHMVTVFLVEKDGKDVMVTPSF